MIRKLRIEYMRILLKYWLYKANKSEKANLPNLVYLNNAFKLSDRITELSFK